MRCTYLPSTISVLPALAADPACWCPCRTVSAETHLPSGSPYPILARLVEAPTRANACDGSLAVSDPASPFRADQAARRGGQRAVR